ncbi:MAG: hypothetical protein SVX38_14500 [Chloroflexota bacterium]|nr:hypothetical protein [Chloroflexota bacterium]
MTETFPMKQTEAVHVEFSSPTLRLPDAAGTVENALPIALQFCAQKMGLDSHQAVLDRLRQGDGVACKYCHYSLAKQVAEALGSLDENVKSVYICDYDATPEDRCFGQTVQTSLIHMIVWVKRKTGALNSLVEALDRILVQSYADLIGSRQSTNLLDVQMVDDADVKNRLGYGALISSLYNQPIQVWKR